jgi:eukaryotic-like serine/threonine-protein kinase
MNAERWRRIDDLFDRAGRVPIDETKSWLTRVCGRDRELRQEVADLLAHDRCARGFTQKHVRKAVVSLFPETRPRRIGPYRIERELGRGGTGVVFLAHRADDAQRSHVAVKLMRPAFATKANRHLFLLEGEILGRLRHPGIVTLLDAGLTSRRLPYLVLEYVDGQTILDRCRTHKPGVAGRLRLFVETCAAVEHLHEHGIVHCDLKPANILVERAGMVKLLDFGISERLGFHGAGHPARALTPDYASPERRAGDRPTIASDVYSLGAVLYEVLTGRRLKGHMPPSVLRSPLGPIVRRAIDPEAARRYSSVSEFSSAVRHHLAGVPVS